MTYKLKNQLSILNLDTTNENMMDGPKKNPQLARKMMDTFEKTGLVLMRGNREVGDHLDVMRDWANLCFPNVSKYEGGANQRHGTHVANVYEVKIMAIIPAITSK